MRLKGTRTAENLLKSFAGESQARMRYTYYSNMNILLTSYLLYGRELENTELSVLV